MSFYFSTWNITEFFDQLMDVNEYAFKKKVLTVWATKTYRWSEGIDPLNLSFCTKLDGCVTSCPCRFTPVKKKNKTESVGGWMGCRAILKILEKSHLPLWWFEPRIIQPERNSYTDYATPAVILIYARNNIYHVRLRILNTFYLNWCKSSQCRMFISGTK